MAQNAILLGFLLNRFHIIGQLKDQRVIWQKRLSELDISSKNQLSKERERRRCSIQQQLDKSSSTMNQLLEIIDGLEVMNDELADEAKQSCTRKQRTWLLLVLRNYWQRRKQRII